RVPIDAPLFGELSAKGFLLSGEGGMPYVCMADNGMEADRLGEALGIPREQGFVYFTNPEAFAWWRDAHAQLFADGVDVVICNGGEDVPEDAIAFNGDTGRRLHNVYPLLYSRCVHDAKTRFRREPDALPIALARAGWAGSQRYPIPSGGEAQRDWEGLAASIRGALSAGMSGAPYHAAAVGGTYGPPP